MAKEEGPHWGQLRLLQQTAGRSWGPVTWGTEKQLLEKPTTERSSPIKRHAWTQKEVQATFLLF